MATHRLAKMSLDLVGNDRESVWNGWECLVTDSRISTIFDRKTSGFHSL